MSGEMDTTGQRCSSCWVPAEPYGFRPALALTRVHDNGAPSNTITYEMHCPRCDGVFIVYAVQNQLKAGVKR